MWHLLANDALLEAAHLYLLASQVHKTAQQDVKTRFPHLSQTLTRSWDAIFYFRKQIIDGVDACLQQHRQSDQVTIRAMLAVMRLEATTTPRIVRRFLQQRGKRIKRCSAADWTSIYQALQATLYSLQHLFVKVSFEEHIRRETTIDVLKLLSPKTNLRLIRRYLPEDLFYAAAPRAESPNSSAAAANLMKEHVIAQYVQDFLADLAAHFVEQPAPSATILPSELAQARYQIWQATGNAGDTSLFTSLGVPPETLWQDFFNTVIRTTTSAILQIEMDALQQGLCKLIDQSLKATLASRNLLTF